MWTVAVETAFFAYRSMEVVPGEIFQGCVMAGETELSGIADRQERCQGVRANVEIRFGYMAGYAAFLYNREVGDLELGDPAVAAGIHTVDISCGGIVFRPGRG